MKKNIVLPLLLILVFALSRWPGVMPSNCSAAYALVFCAGLYLPGWRGWAVPLGVMAVTDIILCRFHYDRVSAGAFLAFQAPNYVAYLAMIGLGRLLGRKRNWLELLGGGIIGALLFYLITNTASWLELSYAKTLAGWIQALTVGLPGYPQTWEFFLKTLGSGGLFTGLFVGAMKMTESSEESKQEKAEEDEEEAESKEEEAEHSV